MAFNSSGRGASDYLGKNPTTGQSLVGSNTTSTGAKLKEGRQVGVPFTGKDGYNYVIAQDGSWYTQTEWDYMNKTGAKKYGYTTDPTELAKRKAGDIVVGKNGYRYILGQNKEWLTFESQFQNGQYVGSSTPGSGVVKQNDPSVALAGLVGKTNNSSPFLSNNFVLGGAGSARKPMRSLLGRA